MTLSKQTLKALKLFAEHVKKNEKSNPDDHLFENHKKELVDRGLIVLYEKTGNIIMAEAKVTPAGYHYLDEDRLKWENRWSRLIWSIAVPILVSIVTTYLLFLLGFLFPGAN